MSAAYTSTSDFRLPQGQVLEAVDQDGIWMSTTGSGPPPNLTIEGELDVSAGRTYPTQDLIGVLGNAPSFSGATFTLTSTGVLSVTNARLGGTTYGTTSPWSPNISNAGHVVVTGDGRTIGFDATVESATGSVINSGQLTVSSASDFAFGVTMTSGGVFRNTGSIEVYAHDIARGLMMSAFHGQFYNSGTISVTDAGSDFASIAVDWSSTPYPGAIGSFVNDGTLQGDRALVAAATGPIDPKAVDIFVNNGSMLGAVDLGAAPAQLINNGQITGDIDLGGSNDLYDGHAGTATASIRGGDGDDTMTGSANADTISGDAGDDVIDGGAGANQLDGGAGVNTVSFQSSATGVSVDLAAGQATATQTETFTGFQRLLGSERADTLTGSAGADSIAAAGGDDRVFVTAGQDVLDGGAGVDTLSFERVGAGVEAHFANGSASDLASVAGFEVATGSSFGDTLAGGAGVQTIFGGAGSDSILGGEGTNYLRGDDGDDTVVGASGFDYINGNKGDDSIDGGAGGGDWLVGGQANDIIVSHAGDDILTGNMGDDTVNGGAGNETLRGGQADDVLSGGDGNDWLSGDRGTTP